MTPYKLLVFTVLLLFVTGLSAASGMGAQQAAGITQGVDVSVEKGNKGMVSGLKTYCHYYSLDACDSEFGLLSIPGTLYHYWSVDDPDEWYEDNRKGGNGQDSSQSDSKEVHSFD